MARQETSLRRWMRPPSLRPLEAATTERHASGLELMILQTRVPLYFLHSFRQLLLR